MEGNLTAIGLEARFTMRRGESFGLDVDLSVSPGETAALLGPNGAGKSTVVAALAGLLPIDAGTITLANDNLDDPAHDIFVTPEARRIGVVFQDLLLFPHFTVIENVAFGLRSRGVRHEDALARSEDWLRRLGLTDKARSRPGRLSGGQAQRVALARALVIEPDLLLLDEPLSALDVTTRLQLRRALAEHLDGFTGPRLLITHDPTEAFLLADVIHVIEGGVITQSGVADDIRLRPRTPYAADLAGVNLVVGLASDGVIDTGSHTLQIVDRHVSGPVLATIRPSAISIHLREPEGSPRNSWESEIEVIEGLGDRTRMLTGGPMPVAVEVTAAAAGALDLHPGKAVWVSIKATEIAVEPDPAPSVREEKPRTA